jgi:hypothetical protein
MGLALLRGLFGCEEQGQEKFLWPKHNIKAHYAFKLPDAVDECSGAISWTDSTFLTHNDDGPAELYEVTYNGRLVRTLAIPNAENVDWEDITRDSLGTVFIADLGNNRNKRQDLAVYGYKPSTQTTSKIEVRYADQHDFPPESSKQNFDSEAVFWWKGNLYALSKNRGYKTVKAYRITPQAGPQKAATVDSVQLFEPITGAAVSPNKNVLAVLGYGKIYLYRLDAGRSVFAHPTDSIRFKKSGQSEAIWWQDQAHLYVANEAQRAFCFEKMDGSGF